ncbi:MAG: hypothetical protein ACHP7A_05740 [Caulobacterales bacterium]
MSADHRYDDFIDEEGNQSPAPDSTLTERLDAKLAELIRSGYRIQWIEASQTELVALFSEGGDEAILLDPDPTIDRAWYGQFEIRPSDKELVWIYLEGEYDGLSAHIVS